MDYELPEIKRYARVKGKMRFVKVDEMTEEALKRGVVMGFVLGFVLGAVPLWLAYNI